MPFADKHITEDPNGVLLRSSTAGVFSLWDTVTIRTSIDSLTTWALSTDIRPPNIPAIFTPFNYPDASIYIGKELITSGVIHRVTPQFDDKRNTCAVEGYSFPGVLAKCNVSDTEYPLQKDLLTLRELTSGLIAEFGIVIDYQAEETEFLEEITIQPGEPILSLLIRLARHYNILISDTPSGDLLFHQINTQAVPIAQLTAGKSPVYQAGADYVGDSYFSKVIGIATSSEWGGFLDAENAVIVNPHIRQDINRPHVYQVQDIEGIDVLGASQANASRMFATVAPVTLQLEGWRVPTGELWQPGKTITLTAPEIFIPRPSPFLIRAATFRRKPKGGDTTELSLVVADSYTGKIPKTVPWRQT